MRKHLEGELTKAGTVDKEDDNTTKEDKTIITVKQMLEDNQLKAGVDILKSLMIMNK